MKRPVAAVIADNGIGRVGGSWIVKLPAREFPGIPENEFALRGSSAWNTPAVELIAIDSIKNLPKIENRSTTVSAKGPYHRR